MIIVTGGAGFIGSNLVHHLNAIGVTDLLLVDDLTDGEKHRNLRGARFADYLDVADFAKQLTGVGKIEAVLHQGACTDTTERDGRVMMRANFDAARTLLAFAQDSRAPFIYASSAAVYGDGRDGFAEEPGCERPLNVYGFSKLAFDNHARWQFDDARAPIIGLRYFNVYGPNEAHKKEMASLVHQLYVAADAGEPLRVFEGSERFKRDFVYVDDICAIVLHFLAHPTTGIYNCGTGESSSCLELAQAVQKHRLRTAVVEKPFPEALSRTYQTFTEANLSRLRGAGCSVDFKNLAAGVAICSDQHRLYGGYRC